MASKRFQDHLLSVCSALGGFEPTPEGGRVYVLGDEVEDCLMDLKRFARKDVVIQLLGEWGILQKDLLPILDLAAQIYDKTLIELVVDILLLLTRKQDFEEPGDQMEHLKLLISFKQGFLFWSEDDRNIFHAFISILYEPLSRADSERAENEAGFVRQILILLGQLAAIPDSPHNDDEAPALQNLFFGMLCKEKIIDIILTLMNSVASGDLHAWGLPLLDLWFHLIYARSPGMIFSRIHEQNQISQTARNLEQASAAKKLIASSMSRHSRFSGSFSIISGNNLRACMSLDRGLLKQKPEIKTNLSRQMKRPVINSTYDRVSEINLEIAVYLHDTSLQFLQHCFNGFILTFRRKIESGKIGKKSELYFLYITHYMLEFYSLHRQYLNSASIFDKSKNLLVEENACECVSSAINLDHFNFIIRELEEKAVVEYPDEVQAAVRCYKMMLTVVDSVSSDLSEFVIGLENNLIYQIKTFDCIRKLISHFKLSSQSKSLLIDLIETNHAYLRLIEHYVKLRGQATFVVMRTKRVRRRLKAQAAGESEKNDATPAEKNEKIPSEKEAGISNGMHQSENVENAQSSASDPHATLPKTDAESIEGSTTADTILVNPESSTDVQNDKKGSDTSSSDGEEEDVQYQEDQMEIRTYELDLADDHLVGLCVNVLCNYKENSAHTNHCIVKLLHRILFTPRGKVYFYKLSVLSIFSTILQECDSARQNLSKDVKEIRDFIVYVTRGFFDHLKRYPLLAAEIFFPKSRRDLEFIDGTDDDRKSTYIQAKKTFKMKPESENEKNEDDDDEKGDSASDDSSSSDRDEEDKNKDGAASEKKKKKEKHTTHKSQRRSAAQSKRDARRAKRLQNEANDHVDANSEANAAEADDDIDLDRIPLVRRQRRKEGGGKRQRVRESVRRRTPGKSKKNYLEDNNSDSDADNENNSDIDSQDESEDLESSNKSKSNRNKDSTKKKKAPKSSQSKSANPTSMLSKEFLSDSDMSDVEPTRQEELQPSNSYKHADVGANRIPDDDLPSPKKIVQSDVEQSSDTDSVITRKENAPIMTYQRRNAQRSSTEESTRKQIKTMPSRAGFSGTFRTVVDSDDEESDNRIFAQDDGLSDYVEQAKTNEARAKDASSTNTSRSHDADDEAQLPMLKRSRVTTYGARKRLMTVRDDDDENDMNEFHSSGAVSPDSHAQSVLPDDGEGDIDRERMIDVEE